MSEILEVQRNGMDRCVNKLDEEIKTIKEQSAVMKEKVVEVVDFVKVVSPLREEINRQVIEMKVEAQKMKVEIRYDLMKLKEETRDELEKMREELKNKLVEEVQGIKNRGSSCTEYETLGVLKDELEAKSGQLFSEVERSSEELHLRIDEVLESVVMISHKYEDVLGQTTGLKEEIGEAKSNVAQMKLDQLMREELESMEEGMTVGQEDIRRMGGLVGRQWLEVESMGREWKKLEERVQKIEETSSQVGLVATPSVIKSSAIQADMAVKETNVEERKNSRLSGVLGKIIKKERKPIFSGGQIVPQKFLKELEHYYELLEVRTGQEKIKSLHVFLRGNALRWWSLIRDNVTSWESVKELLVGQFYTKLEKKECRKQWESLNYREYCGAEEFALKALEIISVLKPEETEARWCEKVTTKMPEPLRDYMFGREVNNVQKFLYTLKESMYLKNFDTKKYFKVNTYSNTYDGRASGGSYRNKRVFYNRTQRRNNYQDKQNNPRSDNDNESYTNDYSNAENNDYDSYGDIFDYKNNTNNNYSYNNTSNENNSNDDDEACYCDTYEDTSIRYDNNGYWYDNSTGYWINPRYLGDPRNYIPDFRYRYRTNGTNHVGNGNSNNRTRASTPPRSPTRSHRQSSGSYLNEDNSNSNNANVVVQTTGNPTLPNSKATGRERHVTFPPGAVQVTMVTPGTSGKPAPTKQ